MMMMRRGGGSGERKGRDEGCGIRDGQENEAREVTRRGEELGRSFVCEENMTACIFSTGVCLSLPSEVSVVGDSSYLLSPSFIALLLISLHPHRLLLLLSRGLLNLIFFAFEFFSLKELRILLLLRTHFLLFLSSFLPFFCSFVCAYSNLFLWICSPECAPRRVVLFIMVFLISNLG